STTIQGPDVAAPVGIYWTLTGTGQGNVSTVWNVAGNVTFTNVQALTGGTGIDAFVFQPHAAVAGVIDGGTGAYNSLDYRAFDTGVTVHLSVNPQTGTGDATSTAGIHNIQVVDGSHFNDLLVGNNQNDTFVSFGGSDTLLGGSGNDTFVVYGVVTNTVVD